MKTLGSRLKDAREAKRYTQKHAAEILGISNGTLSGYERNYRDPDTTTLNKMAELYEVKVDWLLGKTASRSTEYVLPKTETQMIINEIVEKYEVDLTDPGARDKLENIIKIVYSDYKKKS